MRLLSTTIEAPRTEEQNDKVQLPPQKGLFYRTLRHPLMRPYFRLMVAMIALNIYVFSQITESLSFLDHGLSVDTLGKMALVNFLVGAFFRQQWVVNTLFRIATSVPKSFPLSVRWACGKVYHFGGIHIGTFFAGSVWHFMTTAQLLIQPTYVMNMPVATRYTALIIAVVLMAMMIVALPQIRHKHHDLFERVVRFGLWFVVYMLWGQLWMVSEFRQIPMYKTTEFFGLLYLTGMIALPWLRLRRVAIDINTPSNHVALANFNYGVTPFAGSSTDLSTNPLLEWHSFANIPSPGEDGFRLTISRAGDWTGDLIDKKPKHIWVKGIPAAGVGNIELCFKKVVWVATGSGIGPCVPHLLDKKVPSRLVWSTRTPEKTYGHALVEEIQQAQQEAMIWDTTAKGKPDLTQLAYEAYKEFDAEAVIVISNQKTTFKVNYELESRGIPCFGAIWDS
tara:strand:+ start:88082 stop:89431 length:1350 start_codon:yes stop_codon:yes gene_type:complete